MDIKKARKRSPDFYLIEMGIKSMKNKSEISETKKMLRSKLGRIERDSDMNLSLFYGLIFGLLASSTLTLTYELIIKDLSGGIQTWILVGLLLIISFFIHMMRKSHKKSSRYIEELEYFDGLLKG